MSQSAGSLSWVHCDICKNTAIDLKCMFHFTSCGRTVCNSCCSRLSDVACASCRGVCRTVAMNNKAPANALNMVKDISGQLKNVFKTLNWQERQKKSLVEHRVMVVEKLQKEERRQGEEIARVEEELQNRRAVLKKQEEQEAMLKAELNSLARVGVEGVRRDHGRQREIGYQGQPWLGGGPAQGLSPGGGRSSAFYKGPTQGLSPGGGAMSSAFYKGMAKHSPANSFLGERLDSSRRSVGSGGSRRSREDQNFLGSRPSEFMQMKTPAAWYKPGPLRHGPSPR